MAEMRGSKYRAFISYSHAADGKLAPALETGLEQFAKPWYRLRSMRVFRDQTGLSATPELWGSIERALASSDYFILLASPQSAQSKWVVQEIDWWLKNRSASTLLIVCTDGEIAWDAAAGDFDWAKTNALPGRLKNVFPQEPLFIDLRWAREATDLSLRRPRFAEEVARLSSALLGVSLEDVLGQEVTQHRQTLRFLRFASLALALVTIASVFTAFLALEARKRSLGLKTDAEAKASVERASSLALQLAEQSLNLATENPELAVLLASESLRLHPNEEGKTALRASLAGPLAPVLSFSDKSGSNDTSSFVRFSPDGSRLLVLRETLELRDAATGTLLREFPTATNVSIAYFCGSRLCTLTEDGFIRMIDPSTGKLLHSFEHPDLEDVLFSADGNILLALGGSALSLWNTSTGTKIATPEFPRGHCETWDGSFHPDGSRVAIGCYSDIYVFATDTGRLLATLEGHSKTVRSLNFTSDGRWLISASEDGTVRKWRAGTTSSSVVWTDSSEIYGAIVTPDDRFVVIRNRNKVLSTIDLETGKRIAQVELRVDINSRVFYALSPNGECLLTASSESPTAELWETRTGTRLAELPAKDAEIRSLDFSPSGTRIAIGYIFGPTQVFPCDQCGSVTNLLDLARQKVSRTLTAEERSRFTIPAVGL